MLIVLNYLDNEIFGFHLKIYGKWRKAHSAEYTDNNLNKPLAKTLTTNANSN